MRTNFIGALGAAALVSGAAILSSSAGAALAAEAQYVKRPAVACYSRAVMQRVGRDDAVAPALLGDRLDEGACRWLPPGALVLVEDDDILAGLTKVRIAGDVAALWTRSDALTDD